MSKNSSMMPSPWEPPKSVLPTPTSPMQQTEQESHSATCQYGPHGPTDTISDRYYHGPEGESGGDGKGE